MNKDNLTSGSLQTSDAVAKQEKQVVEQLKKYSNTLEELRSSVDNLEERLNPVLYSPRLAPEEKDESAPVPMICPLADDLRTKNELLMIITGKIKRMIDALEI